MIEKSFTGGNKFKPITEMTGVQRGAVKSRIKINRNNRIAAQSAKKTFNNRGDLIRLDVYNRRQGRTMGYSDNAVLQHLKRNGVSVARTVPSGNGRTPSAKESTRTLPGRAKEIVYDDHRRATEAARPWHRNAYRTPVGRDSAAPEPRYKKQVAKSYVPWDGVTSEVSKMSPDQSELHIQGSSGQKRGRLRKLPPDAIRRK